MEFKREGRDPAMSGEKSFRLMLAVFIIATAFVASWLILFLMLAYTKTPWVYLYRPWWNNLLIVGLILNAIVFFFNMRSRDASRRKRRSEGEG